MRGQNFGDFLAYGEMACYTRKVLNVVTFGSS